MAYWIAAISMTLSNCQGHSVLQAFQMWFFRLRVQLLTIFKLTARRAVPFGLRSFLLIDVNLIYALTDEFYIYVYYCVYELYN